MAKTNRIPFQPRWPGAIEGHSVNSIKKWFPRLCAEYEFDDLLQEAYIVFMRCKSRSKADNPAWFMAFYSRALNNRLNNLAAKCGRTISLEVADAPEPAGHADDGFMAVVLAELPIAVKRLVHTALFEPGAAGRDAYRKLESCRRLYPALQWQ